MMTNFLYISASNMQIKKLFLWNLWCKSEDRKLPFVIDNMEVWTSYICDLAVHNFKRKNH